MKRISICGLRIAICGLTYMGFAVGCVAVMLIPSVSCIPWLIASLAIDAVDGAIARYTGCSSEFGAILDWTVDSALSYMIAYRVASMEPLLAVSICAILVIVQTVARYRCIRMSGRSAATALAIIWALTEIK